MPFCQTPGFQIFDWKSGVVLHLGCCIFVCLLFVVCMPLSVGPSLGQGIWGLEDGGSWRILGVLSGTWGLLGRYLGFTRAVLGGYLVVLSEILVTFWWPFGDLWVTFGWLFGHLLVTFCWPFFLEGGGMERGVPPKKRLLCSPGTSIAPLGLDGTEPLNHTRTDMATLWLNQPSGADSVKILFFF